MFTIDAVDWAAIFNEAHDVVVRIYLNGPRNSAFIEAATDVTIIRIV